VRPAINPKKLEIQALVSEEELTYTATVPMEAQ
jgi:hypothetical protein